MYYDSYLYTQRCIVVLLYVCLIFSFQYHYCLFAGSDTAKFRASWLCHADGPTLG